MASTTPHSPAYHHLLQAGPHHKPLQQVHAHLIVSGIRRSRSLLTKLTTLACTAGSIFYSRQILQFIPNPDAFLFNSIIKAASKSGFPFDALCFYKQMRQTKDVSCSNFTFTAIIKACADLSAICYGRVIHNHVIVCGFGSDSFVQAGLVTFYAKSGDLGVAKMVFDQMPERTVIAWNSMISGYEQNGFGKEAIEVFNQMRRVGMEPDSTTLVSVLSACSQLGALSLGEWVHEYIVTNGFDVNVILGTSLINMYTKCGHVTKAREIFDGMAIKNVMTWTSMISGYGMHGYAHQAIEVFRQMKSHGPRPNDVTFIAVLSSCAHAGFVKEGNMVYNVMKQDYGIVPRVEHHVCMVDMLGRAGLLNEAFRYIKESISGRPAAAVWTAMLGACKMYKNYDLGVQVAEQLLNVEPDNPAHYVLLSNIYALAGNMDRVEVVRKLMISKGLKKQVGYSSIDIDHVTHVFCMGDKSHPHTTEIYRYLDELMLKLSEAGYTPKTNSMMHELEEEEKEDALKHHSEKLAIAFGLMKTIQGSTIRIIKNLRMCDDCHSAIKFISSVTRREIIVRDKHRFHHFKDGSCSCLDYW
ncbi:hypothetical protein ACHQM5_017323 [Ranunculus cassubicifolius]